MSWSRVPFARWTTLSFPSMQQWLDIQQEQTRVPVLLNDQIRFMIWQIKGYRFFTFNCLQSAHWVRVEYCIVINWTHVSVMVQDQSDGCSFSCKDGAVVWRSFWTVGRLSHHSGNCGWWPLLLLLSRSFWSHQCKLHHVIFVTHDTQWI